MMHKGIGYVEVKVAIDIKCNSKGRFTIGCKAKAVLWHSNLFNAKAWKKSGVLLIFEAIMGEIDIDRR